MTTTPPTIRVRGALSEALASSVLGALDESSLRAWLMPRRWFAAKARELRSVRVAGVIPLQWGGEGDAIARVEVDTGEGPVQHYQLPLAVRAAEAVDPELPILMIVESERERGVVIDATGDAGFRRRLAEAFRSGGRFGDANGRWSVEPLDATGVALDAAAESRVLRGEQSNTSIVFGTQAILKLFRRVEPGINPDVEIGRFLTTRAHFQHTPALLGALSLSWSGSEPAVAGMLQRLLPEVRDAWEFTLEHLDAHLRGSGPDFTTEATTLGRITRELHEALASAPDDPEFAPAAVDDEDVRSWRDAAQRSLADALSLLTARVDSLAEASRAAGERLLASRDRLSARADELANAAGGDAGLRIRHHGDYHLGQVLRTEENGSSRFMIIDFEGEPSRPLAERRARQSPLRDVAGMLRSFAYAAASGAMTRGDEDAAVTARAWERSAREAFLAGYFEGEGASKLLPRAAEPVRALISLFELEKVSYELGYELNNRPDWAWIPLQGLERELALE